jgi:hypothetical protein
MIAFGGCGCVSGPLGFRGSPGTGLTRQLPEALHDEGAHELLVGRQCLGAGHSDHCQQ